MGFTESSLVSKISIVVMAVSVLFIIIGLATDNWLTVEGTVSSSVTIKLHYGLWKFCALSECQTYTGDQVDDTLTETRAFVILSMLLALAATALIVVAVVKSEIRPLQIAALILPYIAGLFAFVGVGIFGGDFDDTIPSAYRDYIKLSWSLALTAVGGVLAVIAGVLMTVSLVTRTNN